MMLPGSVLLPAAALQMCHPARDTGGDPPATGQALPPASRPAASWGGMAQRLSLDQHQNIAISHKATVRLHMPLLWYFVLGDLLIYFFLIILFHIKMQQKKSGTFSFARKVLLLASFSA